MSASSGITYRRPSPDSRAPLVVRAAVLGGLVAFIVCLPMFVQGWKAVPVDKVALHYSGGPIQGEHFEEVVPPGTRTHFYGLLERLYELPATQRNYIMSKDPSQGQDGRAEFVGAPASDSVVTQWESATYFKLNTRPEVVRSFFEQICLKYDCTDLEPGGGWDRMLADTFRQQIVAAIQAEARQHTSEEIYSDPDTLPQMQSAIGSSLKQRINEVLGGEFFCGPTFRPEVPGCPEFTFVIKEISLPENIQNQYNDNRASALAVEKARTDAVQRQVQAQGEADSQAILRNAPELTPGQRDYIRAQAELECSRRTDCVFLVGDGTTSVEVNTATRRP